MPRILGVDIPGNKKLQYSLRYIYGIGPARALEVCTKVQLDPNMRANDLTDNDVAQITRILQDDYRVEGDLRRKVSQDIRRLISIRAYRGIRHQRNLPCHGQRTKTNARTRKGKKNIVGAIRDRAARRASRA